MNGKQIKQEKVIKEKTNTDKTDKKPKNINDLFNEIKQFYDENDNNNNIQNEIINDLSGFVKTLTLKEKTNHPKTDVNNDKLKDELIKYRREKSKEKNIPAYSVLSNNTIEQIVLNLPLNHTQLSNIKGIGKKKMDQYGNDIIKICKTL